jgi:hypothetical protein
MAAKSTNNKRLPINVLARLIVISDINSALELGYYCLEKGTEALSTKQDREIVSDSLDWLKSQKDNFIDLFDSLESEAIENLKILEDIDEKKYFGIWLTLLSVIGPLTTIHATVHTSKSNERFVEMKRILQMQKNKAKKHAPSEIALIAAIRAEHGTKEATKPFKEAGAILSAVNLRLEAGGLKPVKVDVIRRRLEKWPALLKSAEKFLG